MGTEPRPLSWPPSLQGPLPVQTGSRFARPPSRRLPPTDLSSYKAICVEKVEDRCVLVPQALCLQEKMAFFRQVYNLVPPAVESFIRERINLKHGGENANDIGWLDRANR